MRKTCSRLEQAKYKYFKCIQKNWWVYLQVQVAAQGSVSSLKTFSSRRPIFINCYEMQETL